MATPWEALGLLAATALFCGAAGVFPFLNTEAYLVVVALHPGRPAIWLVAVAAACGQMAGKMVLFAVGRGAIRLPRWRKAPAARGRCADRMDRCRAWTNAHPWGPAAVTLASATAGMPPFAVWSVMAGSLKTEWGTFLFCGLAGRYLRFISLLAAPALLVRLLG